MESQEWDMVKDGQIHIVIDESQKTRWQEYVEESNRFESLTDLIRISVEAEISSEGQSLDAVSPALEEEVQTLLDDVGRIRKDVTWLRSQEQDEVAISDLAQDVFDELDTLPEPASPVDIPDDVEDTESYRQQQAAAQVIQPDDAEEAESDGATSYTAKALAERFDTTEDRIHDAINHLQDQFLPVIELEVSGDTQYFKEA